MLIRKTKYFKDLEKGRRNVRSVRWNEHTSSKNFLKNLDENEFFAFFPLEKVYDE